jgi:hypothetical protein
MMEERYVMLTNTHVSFSPLRNESSPLGGTMSGVKSTTTPFLESRYEGLLADSVEVNVTSVAMAADSSMVFADNGDQLAMSPSDDANDTLHARSIADVVSKKMGEPSIDAQDQLGTWWPVRGFDRLHLLLSFGYQSNPIVLNVH